MAVQHCRQQRLVKHSYHGALPLFRQTHATIYHLDGAAYRWSARNNRKGRHRLEAKNDETKVLVGSIVWCINGVYAFTPLVNSHFVENDDSVGWTAWLGATIFFLGGILAFLEAWSVDDDNFFGWHLVRKRDDVEAASTDAENSRGCMHVKEQVQNLEKRLKSQDLGLWAAGVQMVAATIFWMAGWTSLPIIFNSIEDKTILFAWVYWTPQLAGIGFMISGLLFMLETQKKWYKPEWLNPGWHVGFWNIIGGLGFLLCPAFGYSRKSWRQYQSALSTFWGSWAFLISSVPQLYEAVNPVQPKQAS
ncbi:hypothetical protein AURDEDRAFT_157681 [Auricularia subglabra TFB-10046 SS5]|nr:hypothetical protein AURDEDRAFT_157681 [Auricularia subglabra TFB-10046 SS5]